MTPPLSPGRPLRVGLLGCSDIAARRFLPALLATPRAVPAGIASRDPARAAALRPAPDCTVHSYDSLLAAPGIDLVYLSLPNHLHEQWTLAALAAGKHVICEKPLAMDPAAAERMTAAAEQRNLLLYENLMYLHHPLLARVKEVLPRLGAIRVMRAAFGFTLVDPDNVRLDPAKGGGAFHDLARYPLSAALQLLTAEPDHFSGVAFHRGGLTTGLHGHARTAAGELFQFDLDFCQQYESFYELVGEHGRLRVDRAFTPPPELAVPVQLVCGTADRSFTVPAADQFRLMLEHVCDLVTGPGDFTAPHARNRTLAALAEKLRAGCVPVARP